MSLISFVLSREKLTSDPRETMKQALGYAYSKSPRAAVGVGSSGRTFLGVNVELPDLPPIHATQFLLANLAMNSEPQLKSLSISSNASHCDVPCGNCLKVLEEITKASSPAEPQLETSIFITKASSPAEPQLETSIFITDESGENGHFNPLWMYLPTLTPPGPGNITGILDLHRPKNGLKLMTDVHPERFFCDSTNPRCLHLDCWALAAANRAYAPHSRCPAGVALLDRDGRVYTGWCIDSVVHYPSLGPLQFALVEFVAVHGGEKDFRKIVDAVLVEKKDANVSHANTARSLIKKIAGCELQVVFCQ